MYPCLYDQRTSGRGCPNERALDFDFCQEHLNTPRGKAHIMDVVARHGLTTPSMVQKAIDDAKRIPEEDYHTSALEQMAETLQVIQDWVTESRQNLDSIDKSQWRYRDRSGQEQVHTYVVVYERALDRISRHLGAMSKVSLQDKTVSLGKAQVDMMIRMVMTVITELRLNDDASRRAQALLLEQLERDAHLSGRVDHYAQQQLAPVVIDASRN